MTRLQRRMQQRVINFERWLKTNPIVIRVFAPNMRLHIETMRELCIDLISYRACVEIASERDHFINSQDNFYTTLFRCFAIHNVVHGYSFFDEEDKAIARAADIIAKEMIAMKVASDKQYERFEIKGEPYINHLLDLKVVTVVGIKQ